MAYLKEVANPQTITERTSLGPVEFDAYLSQVRTQAEALRAAAIVAGPDADVPSCPNWTVRRLVRHIGRVHNQVGLSLDASPDGPPPKAERAPEDWDTLLTWWDAQVDTLVTKLAAVGPDSPAWAFKPGGTSGWWARRQAHETAIHRLDAEVAAGQDDRLLFDPELAADGIDEALTVMLAGDVAREGTVLFHAADAGRAWLVTVAGGTAQVGAATDVDADAAVVGTADAVYRAVWHRPSTAVVTGDHALVAALRNL